ncbi:MAG: VPLPA-CTERM sorting domain-containing protein [Gammaproteobacteria bacterium]
MKQLTAKTLLAVSVLTVSGVASATTVYLNQSGLRSAGGTAYNMIYGGQDGGPASTATWDWDAGTGVLTMTSGFLQQAQRIGSVPGPSTSLILSDLVTGLVIDTVNGTTSATTYNCIEGGFGAGTGASSCGGYALGVNNINESSIAYNVGGSADCTAITAGGDDPVNPLTVYRGLQSAAGGPGCGDHTGRGALDMVLMVQDNVGIGGTLILANWNSDLAFNQACVQTAPGAPGMANCNRAHWLIFSTNPVPVPAAVWLFGSAVGLLGVARRRRAA